MKIPALFSLNLSGVSKYLLRSKMVLKFWTIFMLLRFELVIQLLVSLFKILHNCWLQTSFFCSMMLQTLLPFLNKRFL